MTYLKKRTFAHIDKDSISDTNCGDRISLTLILIQDYNAISKHLRDRVDMSTL